MSSKKPPAVCLICLGKFRGDVDAFQDDQAYRYRQRLLHSQSSEDEEDSSPCNPRTPLVTLDDLSTKFLHFTSRYLTLKETSASLLEALREYKDWGGGSLEIFCDGCKELVRYVCDLYAELQIVQLHLVWKLSLLEGKLGKLSGTSEKYRKALVRSVAAQLHVKDKNDILVVKAFRKALESKCLQIWKGSLPRSLVPVGLFPEHRTHSHIATKTSLIHLIAVFLLASPSMYEMREEPKPNPPSERILSVREKMGKRRNRKRNSKRTRTNQENSHYKVQIKEEGGSNMEMEWEGEDAVGEDTQYFSNLADGDNGEGSDWSAGAASASSKDSRNSNNDSNQCEDSSKAPIPRRGYRRTRKRKTGVTEVDSVERHGVDDDSELDAGNKNRSRAKRKKQTEIKAEVQIKRTFTCSFCEKKFLGQKLIFEHLKSVHETSEKSHHCMFCPKNFTFPQTLEYHRFLQHPYNEIPCEEVSCKDTHQFNTLEELEQHLKTHLLTDPSTFDDPIQKENNEKATELVNIKYNLLEQEIEKEAPCIEDNAQLQLPVPESEMTKDSTNNDMNTNINVEITSSQPKILHCSKCHWGFLDPDLLKLHEMTHVETQSEDFLQCPKCVTFYQTLKTLQFHYYDAHGKLAVPIHECKECGKKLSNQYSWRCHMKRHKRINDLGPNANVTCPTCGFRASGPERLENHMKRHDPNNWIFSCSEVDCKAKFPRKQALEGHILKIHGPKIIPCPFKCGALFATRNETGPHLRIVHCKSRFVCDVCGRSYKSESNFKKHKEVQHGPNGPPNYVCSECGMSFKSDYGLQYHIGSVHTPNSEKRYGCPHCPKRYHRKQVLKLHVKTCAKINGMVTTADAEEVISGAYAESKNVIRNERHKFKSTCIYVQIQVMEMHDSMF